MLLLLPLPHPMSTALLHVWLWPVLASTSIRAGPGSRRAHTRSAAHPHLRPLLQIYLYQDNTAPKNAPTLPGQGCCCRHACIGSQAGNCMHNLASPPPSWCCIAAVIRTNALTLAVARPLQLQGAEGPATLHDPNTIPLFCFI